MDQGSNDKLGTLPGRYRLHFECTNSPYCYFSKRMSLDRLIERHGPNFLVEDLYRSERCPLCGTFKFLVICTPVHHSYPADKS